ncbi:MAG: type II CAAX endopeptidase family protein [Syntrophorhabdales bacterium]|jgi:membrane protease YdiL (CAAX protease family)
MDMDDMDDLDDSDDRPMAEDARGVSTKSLLFETIAFLSLILPALILPYFVSSEPDGGGGFIGTAVATILHDLGFLCLVVFFVWRNGEPWGRIGWAPRKPAREVLLGFSLFLLMTFSADLVERIITLAGINLPSHPLPSSLIAGSPAGYILGFVLVVVVAISEETVFRGYLIARLAVVFRSRAAAVILSTLIFSIGHGYEGLTGVVAVFFIGLFLAVIYIWRGSLIAPVVIHILQDLAGLLSAVLSKHA